MSVLFISEQTLKDRSIINDNVDMKIVRFAIETAQDIYIHPVLGTDLYEAIQAGITGNSLTTAETTLLDTYIRNTLIFYTLTELPMPLTYKFYNKSLVKKTSENSELPTMSETIDIMNYYKNRAEWYEDRLVKYLKESQRTNIFPEYTLWSSRIDAIRPKRYSYTTSIYLGIDNDSRLSASEMYQGGPASGENVTSDETYIVGTTTGAPVAGSFVWNLPISYQGKRIRLYRETQLESQTDPGAPGSYYDFNNSGTPSITVHRVAFGDNETLQIQTY